MKRPHLIQRCTIKKPLNDFKGKKLSDAVDMDYMGNSYFEFGATRKSLEALHASNFNVRRVALQQPLGGDPAATILRIAFPNHWLIDQEQAYIDFLSKLRFNIDNIDRDLEEPSGFPVNCKDHEDIDLWWDIENHVIWSFDKAFMNNRLESHLKASWKHMAQHSVLIDTHKI
jgi:hypothetical protein